MIMALIWGIMLEDGSLHTPRGIVERPEGIWSEKLDPIPIPGVLEVSVYDFAL